MTTILEAKQWLRAYAARQRREISPSERQRQSRVAVSHLLKSLIYKKSKTIAVYLSFGNEVQTERLVERAWKDHKTVLIPMTSLGLDRPFFCQYKKGDLLKKTKFGPLELAEKKKPVSFSEIDLVIVPGLAFDERGHRLGYGGGTYDRILAKTPKAKHVGMFFSRQTLAHLPKENHDRPLGAITSEKGFLSFLANMGY